jgi:hypothetical protein
MLKKIFKFLIVLIILLALGLGIYWLLDRGQGGNGNIISNTDFNIGDFFPFGTGGGNTTSNTPGTNDPRPEIPEPSTTPPRMWQISLEPQSGAIASTSADTTFVRFVDKATGNIFESSLFVTGLKRLTNTTIPKVYEAHWQPKADAVVLRYLDERTNVVKTAIGRLTPMNASGASSASTGTSTSETGASVDGAELLELRASFLPDNIGSVAVHPRTGALAYAVRSDTGSKIFVTGAATPTQIFESAIKDFAVAWAGNTVALQTKPSASAGGFLYYVKTTTAPVERVLGGQIGLNTLPSPDGTKVFYSISTGTGGSFGSGIYTVATGASLDLSISSFREKCVWTKDSVYLFCASSDPIPSGTYPDHWYQGKVSFNDSFWRISASTGATELVIDPNSVTDQDIDATNLMLDPNEDYLIFTNKIDSSLWSLRIQRGS